MAIIGYVKVSSRGQSLEVQLDKLKHCDKVFKEDASATSFNRPKLKACLEYVEKGDTLVVTRLDRLARSIAELCNIMDELVRKNVEFQVLDQNIDTSASTGAGHLLFNMLGAISQFEREVRTERHMDGVKKALEQGVRFGRASTMSTEQIADLKEKKAKGAFIKELMHEFKISRASIYKYLSYDSHDKLPR